MDQNKIETKRLKEILNSFRGKKVLIFGDIMVDRYIWGTVSRISPEAPVPIVNITRESYTLGGATNVLNNIYALGGEVYLAGVIGNDDMGKTVFSEIKKMNIGVEGIIMDNDRPTTLKTRIIAHNQQVVRLDREKKDKVKDNIKNKIIKYLDNIIKKADIIVISDYAKGVVTPELIKYIINLAKNYGRNILVDPQVDHFHSYHGVTCLTPNHHEAGFAAGIPIVDEKTLDLAAKKLIKELNCKGILITQGEDGMSYFGNNGDYFHIPAMAREVFDVTGAGDTVISAFSLALASGASMYESAYIGNLAAGIVIGKVGTAVTTIKEILHEVEVERVGWEK
ncbi:MAG: D-glycero-beta-D-manno-heptose-7-phosphate kinase [bacterium]